MTKPAIAALPAGFTLGNYRIARVLGAGGFGVTYRAVEPITDRVVAVKEYLPGRMARRAADGITVKPRSADTLDLFAWGLERFRDEARTLIAVRHPNIVPVLQYFEANGTGYIVMEYVSGATLGWIIKDGKTLYDEEVRQILDPLLAGLEAIHARGFLHRDIKPDNVFVRRDGTPLLIDFGAAREALGQRGHTVILTRGYAPPEQYQRGGAQGPWTDLYALGGTLYRCMTGRVPADALDRAAALAKGRPDPLPRLADAAAETYDAAVVALVERCLAVDDAGRPRSVAEARGLLRSMRPRTLADRTLRPAEMPAPAAEDPAEARGRALFWIMVAVATFGLLMWAFAMLLSLLGLEADPPAGTKP
jgi:serine/threonine protein kinase